LCFAANVPFPLILAGIEKHVDVPQNAVSLEKSEDGLDLWNSPQGPVWTVHGDSILPFLLTEQANGIYEPKGHEVRSGDIALDCGANIGVLTRKALSRGAKLVVAIEPPRAPWNRCAATSRMRSRTRA
jgi:hypothetical protein